MESTQKISFHDSSIISICRQDSSIVFELENVIVEDGMRRATVCLTHVTSIFRDGISIDDIVPVYPDGEIWTFEDKDGIIQLIVEWTDFKTHRSQVHSYNIVCDSFDVELR